MHEIPLRYLFSTVNNYCRRISLQYYSVHLLNMFFLLCISVSSSAWYKQIHVLAHMNENVIDSSSAEPATYCQTATCAPKSLIQFVRKHMSMGLLDATLQ